MTEKTLTCISCPLGCLMTAQIDENNQVVSVAGNSCKRGEAYAQKELTSPSRTVTSTVRISGASIPLAPVRTETDIPKEKIFDCMKEISAARVQAPVRLGDVIIHNVAGTGVNVIATRSVSDA